MSPASALSHGAESFAFSLVDQRLHPRYPISLELHYRVLKGGRIEHSGVGRTLNISSGGVLFEANDIPFNVATIELVMSWPFVLDDVCALNLVMRGHVVRREDRKLAVKAAQHEFRTSGLVPRITRPAADRGAS